jgi:hypothetical protein
MKNTKEINKNQVSIESLVLKAKYRELKRPVLLKIAKTFEIKRRWDMRKEELIDNIVEEKAKRGDFEVENNIEEPKRTTRDYADNAEVGIIVAFKYKGNMLSGKIKEICPDGFKVQTIRGTEFYVLKENVKWFKTGRRWPKHIFTQLRGDSNGKEKEGK